MNELRTAALGLLCYLSQTFQLLPPGVSTRVTKQEHPAAEGGTVGKKCPGILPKCRLSRYIQGSFTCRKVTTWDRRLYFPSEGRRAEDFFALKIQRLQPGVNPRTWVPKASTLPLDHQSRGSWWMKYYLSRPFLPVFSLRIFLIHYHYDISHISFLPQTLSCTIALTSQYIMSSVSDRSQTQQFILISIKLLGL